MKRSIGSAVAISSLALALVGPATGCGYSEDEMKAQLAKEKKCQDDLSSERAASKKMSDEIASLRGQVDALTASGKESGAKAAQLKKALDEAEARARALDALKARLSALKSKLDELRKFGIQTNVRNNMITIVMPGDVLFPPGKETLSQPGKDALAKIAQVIRDNPDLAKRHFQIVGHTDNVPYNGGFKDNVGLSVMRAREVFSFLTASPDGGPKKPGAKAPAGPAAPEGGGLDPKTLSAAGFGALDPIAGTVETQTDEQKKINRRVEIAILPDADELMKLDV